MISLGSGLDRLASFASASHRRACLLLVLLSLAAFLPGFASLQPFDRDERVVVTCDAERPRAVAEQLDLASAVGLDPDGRLRAVDVAQHRPEEQRRFTHPSEASHPLPS